jgi:hypothetical protein
MTGRGQMMALWLVSLLALGGAGAAIYLGMQAGKADAVTSAELDAAIAKANTSAESRIAEITGTSGGTPVVNARTLNGLSSDEFVRATGPIVGHYSCAAQAMGPSLSGYGWTADKNGIYLRSGEIGWFNCPVHLPDGATVTALRGAVRDNSTRGQAVCYMQAIAPDWPAAGYAMAFTAYTGDTTTSGDTTLLDDTITEPVVDNTKYAYVVECELSGETNTSVLLHGVAIDYTLAGP